MWVLLEQPTVRRRLARLLGRQDLTQEDCARLAAATALHDIGKIGQGFQRAPFETVPPEDRGHVGPILFLLRDPSCSPKVQKAYKGLLKQGELHRLQFLVESELFDAVLAHHGSLPSERPGKAELWQDQDGYDPRQACRELVAAICAWFGDAALLGPPPFSLRFNHAFAGLVTLADWVGSDDTVFKMRGEEGAPDGIARFAWSCAKARTLLAARLLVPERVRRACAGLSWDIQDLFGFSTASAGQAAMLDLAPAPAEGRICLIEDETGSGKTEAALLHFLRLFTEGAVEGLYFALPTRAAAVQIHGRIEITLKRLLGAAAPPVILAVPGYLQGGRQGGELPEEAALWPEEERDARWAAARPKRYLAACVAVGTIDQVLMGGLQVRHAQLRSGAMLRLLLAVDEVHSSDVYMTAILRNLLDQHRAAGGHALLLSATLGAEARVRLLEPSNRPAVPPFEDASRLRYPAVWTDPSRPLDSEPLKTGEPKTARIVLDTSWETPGGAIALAVAAARQGARVLMIRNTVRSVVETQQALEQLAPDLSLGVEGPNKRILAPHHARYAPEDRVRLDRALEAVLGNDAPRVHGSVTITSQTAEQSLDIDADFLLTDLCPADVLLQRLGRLHRKRSRPRPLGFEQPCAIVLAPTEAALAAALNAKGEVGNPPLALGLVYPDLIGVVATRRTLQAGVVKVPADNRRLVEAATHPAALEALAGELGERWTKHWAHQRGVRSAQGGQANLLALDWQQPLGPLPDLAERIGARLGLDDRRVEPPERVTGPFGAPISALTIPARWLRGVPAETQPVFAQGTDGTVEIRVGGRQFVYDRFGLRPVAFRAS